MNKPSDKQFFLEKRLLWMSLLEGGPSTEPVPQQEAQNAQEKKEEIQYKEKLDAAKIDEIADRVLKLKTAPQPIVKPGEQGPATAPKFKQALNLALKPFEAELQVKNLDQFLLNGLLENLGKADQKIATMDFRENQDLNIFLRDKKIVSFSIEEGYWKFFDKAGKAVTADYALDGSKDNVEQVVLGKKVQEAKNRDKAAKEKQAADDKVEAERVKPENLEKVSSNYSLLLKGNQKMIDFIAGLAVSLLTDADSNAIAADQNAKVHYPITNDEIEAALTTYIEGYGKGDAEKNFAAFLEDIMKQGFTKCRIQNGRIAFSKDGQKFTSNPLGLEQGGQKVVLYAHPELRRVRAEEAQKKAAEKVEAGKPLQTPYDVAEQEAIKIITGKEKPDERDVNNANIDARYLPAIKSILAYPLNGRPVDVKIPFNDFNPLKCKYYAAADGSYVLSWDNGKGFSRYMPTVKGEPGLKEAQRYFVANLNNGWIFKEVQQANVRDKANFEFWGQRVDDGPKDVEGGGVYYELDWKGGDPDVKVYTERHGVLRVVIDRDNVGPDGVDHYEFRAAGFQDMMRTLKRLQRWAESEGTERDNLRDTERDARFFEDSVKGAMSYRSESMQRGAGKLLAVTSVNNMNPNGSFDSGPFDRGYLVDFDWMQKLDPPARLQIFRNGTGSFEYYLMPSQQKLGESAAGVSPRDAMTNALVLVAEQRQLLTTNGGEKQREKAFNDVLNATGPAYVLSGGVKVVAVSSSGDYYLSRGEGMTPVRFHFGSESSFNDGEFSRAAAQGYLVEKQDDVASKRGAEQQAKAPEQPLPLERLSVTLAPDAPKALPTRVPFSGERRQAVDAVLGELKGKSERGTPNYERLLQYLMIRLTAVEVPADTPQNLLVKGVFEPQAWKILAELTNVLGDPQSKEVQKLILNQLKGEKALKTIDQKSQISGTPELNKLHITRMYINGLLDAFKEDVWQGSAEQISKEARVQVEQAYRTNVLAEVGKIVPVNPKKPSELPVVYDRWVASLLRPRIKLPREFVNEYVANEDKKKVYETYVNEQTAQESSRKNYDALVNQPHQMSLQEVEQKPVAGTGMVAEALKLLKTVKSVERGEINFSRIEGNTLLAQDNSYFNVRAGKAPGPVLPMTLHFFREGGELRVSASDGWNNKSPAEQRDWVGAGETAVDQALARALSRHTGLNTDTLVRPEKAQQPAAAPAATPPAATAAAPATRPAASPPATPPPAPGSALAPTAAPK